MLLSEFSVKKKKNTPKKFHNTKPPIKDIGKP